MQSVGKEILFQFKLKCQFVRQYGNYGWNEISPGFMYPVCDIYEQINCYRNVFLPSILHVNSFPLVLFLLILFHFIKIVINKSFTFVGAHRGTKVIQQN